MVGFRVGVFSRGYCLVVGVSLIFRGILGKLFFYCVFGVRFFVGLRIFLVT